LREERGELNSLENINDHIEQEYCNLTLPMGIHLVYHYLQKKYPNKTSQELYEHLEFKSNPSLSFPKSDISNIKFIENKTKLWVQIELNFLGLLGTASPLPIHYVEQVIEDSKEDMVLIDFFNIFNNHLQKFIYPIWQRHRYYIKYQNDLKDNFSKYMLSTIGLFPQIEERDYKLNFHKLLPFSGILSMHKNSYSSIITLLKHYIEHDDISIDEYIISKAIIPDWQKNSLGEENCSLGDNMIIGNFITVCNLKFRINLNEISWNQLYDYSPLGNHLEALKNLINFILKEPLDFELSLNIKKENIQEFQLQQNNPIFLGINSWIGEAMSDEKIIIEV